MILICFLLPYALKHQGTCGAAQVRNAYDPKLSVGRSLDEKGYVHLKIYAKSYRFSGVLHHGLDEFVLVYILKAQLNLICELSQLFHIPVPILRFIRATRSAMKASVGLRSGVEWRRCDAGVAKAINHTYLECEFQILCFEG